MRIVLKNISSLNFKEDDKFLIKELSVLTIGKETFDYSEFKCCHLINFIVAYTQKWERVTALKLEGKCTFSLHMQLIFTNENINSIGGRLLELPAYAIVCKTLAIVNFPNEI